VEAGGTVPRSNFDGPWKVQGPVTVAGLVGRELSDERSLTLVQAPAYVVRRGLEAGGVGYALVLGEALGRRGLMDLLYTIAPYKAHGPDRFARVLDNWGIFDRAKTNSASENLFQQHVKSLKSNWEIFGQHRDLFVTIFEDQSEAAKVVPILTWEKSPAGVRKWRFDELEAALVDALDGAVPILGGTDGPARPQLDALMGLVTIPYFLGEVRKNWAAWQPLVKDGKSNYIGPASMFVVALRHRRALLNSVLIRSAEEYIDGASQ
jgi:hypothetical protein